MPQQFCPFTTYLELPMSLTKTSASYDHARILLGDDFIPPEEVKDNRSGIDYSQEQLNQFQDTMPSIDVLMWCRDNNYILVAGPPKEMSILETFDLQPEYFFWKDRSRYTNRKFVPIDKVGTGWILLSREPVHDSIKATWEHQQALLRDFETIPNATELIWCITTYKAVRNTYLLPTNFVRTSSRDLDGHRIIVGQSATGLQMYMFWDNMRDVYVGVASNRKFG